MAYVITTHDNLVTRIAANDDDKNNLNCHFPPYQSIDISDEDFIKLKSNVAHATISDGSVVINENGAQPIQDVKDLTEYLNMVKGVLSNFINLNQTDNPFHERAQNYYNYLDTLDTSGMTFPTETNWEKYCQDNGITYLNTLQLP